MYNIYIFDKHMLVETSSNVEESELDSMGEKTDIIYADFEAKTPCGWVVYNDETDKKYYAIKA